MMVIMNKVRDIENVMFVYCYKKTGIHSILFNTTLNNLTQINSMLSTLQ